MRVGAVNEQVTVEADAAQVETRTTSIGQVVDSQRVLEMPLNGREVHELIFLAGMANYPGAASLNTVRNYATVVVLWSRPRLHVRIQSETGEFAARGCQPD